MKTLTTQIHNKNIECIRLDQKSKRDQETNSSKTTRETVWLGGDHCGGCSLQEKYCSCCYEPQSGAVPYHNLTDDWVFEALVGYLSERYFAQSGSEAAARPANTNKVTNIRFSDQEEGYVTHIEGGKDPTRGVTDTTDTSLAQFFSRPIKTNSYSWEVGSDLAVSFSPWTSFWDNSRVENRICNFHLMRADMHVKIVINGNGFYYGRAMACYTPMRIHNNMTFETDVNDLVYHSQRPKIFVDPTTSKGGEMLIPFHHYRNNARVTDSLDLIEMGQFFMRSTGPLRHANGGIEPVDISVFVWAENVELSVITSENSAGLTPQSGDETDQANATGVVSGPASAVAASAAALAPLPYIGKYAKATSKAAGAVAKVAACLGYSRPTITENPAPRRPTAISSLAMTNTPDGAQKLTVDSKQELSIDPNIVGYGKGDSMSIRSIASRESYLTQFPWAISDPAEDLLFSMRVDPGLINFIGSALVFPACAAAVQPFKYWTGTMKVRFQIVCSSFHKGRLRIVYDPIAHSGTEEYNVDYMKIVDLAEETDFTIEIGMGQATTLRKHIQHAPTLPIQFSNTTSLTEADFGNGVLDVHVVNSLSVPSVEPADISVNVYVSMGDDFEVYVPSNDFQEFVFRPQSGYVPESQNTSELDAPEQMMGESIAVESKADRNTALVFVGESIPSFRTLLRRYTKWMAISTNDNLESYVLLRANAFPLYRGAMTGAIHLTAALANYNYVNTLLIHWVTAMFAGWRGSMRYKLLPLAPILDQSWAVERCSSPHTASVTTGFIPASSTVSKTAATAVYDAADDVSSMTGVNGSAYSATPVNPVLEWELPHYSEFRYRPGPNLNMSAESVYNESYRLYGRMGESSGGPGKAEIWTSTGEDFQTYMYVGLGRVYYEATPPPA